MKIKTSELVGASLDWAVAKCEGDASFGLTCEGTKRTALLCIENIWRKFSPSQNWEQAGLIIERDRIEIASYGDQWQAVAHLESESIYERGETPLIAAMRCYVASNMGDEVEIPNELSA
jgi:hypothetical protein